MMRKLTVKQERFALAYVETGNASKAYRTAYNTNPNCKPNTVEKRACELLQNGKVSGRVKQLQLKHAKRHEITVDSITDMLKDDRDQAKGLDQPSAAISAVMGLAKVHGLIIDKKQVTAKVEVSDLTDADLADIATGRGEGTAEKAKGKKGSNFLHPVH